MYRSSVESGEIPDLTFDEFIIGSMKHHATSEPNKIAVEDSDTGQSWTYQTMLEHVQWFENSLHQTLQVEKKEIVLCVVNNCYEVLPICLAAMRRGAIISGLNPVSKPNEIRKRLVDSAASILVVDNASLHNVVQACREIHQSIKAIILIGTLDPAINCSSDILIIEATHLLSEGKTIKTRPSAVVMQPANDLCLLPYSSGTTGQAKGVMLSHRGQVAMCVAFLNVVLVRSKDDYENIGMHNDSILGFPPLFHISGYMFCMFTLMFGAKWVNISKFNPRKFLLLIEKHKTRFLYASPPVVQFLSRDALCREFDLTSLQMIVCGSAALSHETEQQIRNKFLSMKIGQAYGLTETGLASHIAGFHGQPGNAGRKTINVDVKVIDTTTGVILPYGERGEICVRSPTNMLGYWKKSEETKNMFDNDHFLHSGDVGYVDEHGYIYIVDRIKELIKVNAFQVAPAELEALLMSHDCIVDCAVVGVPHAKYGQVPRAFVVRRQAHLSESQVTQFVEDRVSPYKRLLGGCVFVKVIPKTPAGKIVRSSLIDIPNTKGD